MANEMKLVFRATGIERGDCTAPYDVDIISDKPITVKEFIYYILKNNKDEWGYIGIKEPNNPLSIFGDPYCEYRYGELLDEMDSIVLDRKILNITASGGWTRMDYLLDIQ